MAIQLDYQYLAMLLEKHQQEISPSEYQIIYDYIAVVQKNVDKQIQTHQQASDLFSDFKKQTEHSANQQVKERIKDMEHGFVTNSAAQDSMIISEFTTDMDVIIKNMRACLKCDSS
jgi:hypothetical protein